MKVSFTGTRNGMTNRQERGLAILLGRLAVKVYFTHGGADGADTQAHKIALMMSCEVFIRPGSEERYLFWFGTRPGQKRFSNVFSVKPFLERNKDIVNDGEILIAAPKSLKEELRSGTWATVRYARKVGKPIILLDP